MMKKKRKGMRAAALLLAVCLVFPVLAFAADSREPDSGDAASMQAEEIGQGEEILGPDAWEDMEGATTQAFEAVPTDTISKAAIQAAPSVQTAGKMITVEELNTKLTLLTANTLFEELKVLGRYQFNVAGCGVQFREDNCKTNTGASHVDVCSQYEKTYLSSGTYFYGNSSGAKLDGSYNPNGKIYKAYLIVEMNTAEIVKAARVPITLLYAGEDGNTIQAGIKSLCEYVQYGTSENYDTKQGTGILDVTDFVVKNGYGWYYGCNIPFGPGTGDDFSGWKLVVVESSPDIPVRCLTLSIGNKWIAGLNQQTEATINLKKGVVTKKGGTATGQLLYSFTNVDPCFTASSESSKREKLTYTFAENIEDKSQDNEVATINGTRQENAPFSMIMSRNGVPIEHKVSWPNHYYFTNGFDENYNAVYFNTINATAADSFIKQRYPEATGADMELIDVTGKGDAHSVRFKNDKNTLTLRFQAHNYALVAEFLGIAVDLDCPEYKTVQEASLHDKEQVLVCGKVSCLNNPLTDGIGLNNGRVEVFLDKELKIQPDKIKASFTDASGVKTELPSSMYTVDQEASTVAFIFGKNAGGISMENESLEYEIDTVLKDPKILEGKVYQGKNEVSASGSLISNGRDTGYYLDNVAWEKSSFTLAARNKHKVTLLKGTGIQSVLGEGEYYNGDTVTINAVTEDGYDWEGWLNQNRTVIYTVQNYTFEMPDADVTFTALAEKHLAHPTYIVEFDGNDAYGDMSSMHMVYNVEYVLPENEFINPGGEFLYWNTEPDGSGFSFADGETVSNLIDLAKDPNTDRITLYAIWSDTPVVGDYTLTIRPNGGSFAGKAQNQSFTLYTGDTMKVEDPVREGYVFTGWSLYGTESSIKDKTFTMGKEDSILTAKWEASSYTISFDGNGADFGAMADIKLKYGVQAALPKNTFTRLGYEFDGWNTRPDGSGDSFAEEEKVQSLCSVNNGKVTLYAQWFDIPFLSAADRYFTLPEAQQGKVTEEELLKKVSVDGDISGLHVADYDASYWTGLSGETEALVKYEALDAKGRTISAQATIYIVDTTPVYDLNRPYVRFISRKYWRNPDGTLVDPEYGGVEWWSVWRNNPEYTAYMDFCMDLVDSIKYGTVTFQFFWEERTIQTEEVVDCDQVEYYYEFKPEDVKNVKRYVDEHGLGNSKEENALRNFMDEFDHCRKREKEYLYDPASGTRVKKTEDD